MQDSTISLGIELTVRGYAVFPVVVSGDGKVPARGCRWRNESVRDAAGVLRLAERYPDGTHWGIDCGGSGVTVIDLDEGPKHGRVRAGRAAWAALGESEPAAATVNTPAGGVHCYYAENRRAVVGIDSSGKVALDVDVRGIGGFVVAWSLPPAVALLSEVPAVVVERCRPSRDGAAAASTAGGAGDYAGSGMGSGVDGDPFSGPARGFTRAEAGTYVGRALDALREARPGTRNHTLNSTAMQCGHFVPEFWPEAVVAARLAAIAAAIGLGDAEARATVRSGMNAGMREPYSIRGEPSADEQGGGGGDAADALIAEMLDTDGLDTIGDLAPLVKGWLSLNTVTRINGKSTHGKSFVVLDIAAHVASGMEWRGVKTHQGTVVYAIAEGAEGFRKRVRAWEKWHDRRMSGVRFLPRPIQVVGPEWATFIEACRRIEPVMIVLDTQARVTTGVNENDNTEMGVVLNHAEMLRRVTGACVTFVHHLGHNGEEGRGATGIKAGIQTELLVRREDHRITLTTPKQKDDADDSKLEFVMHVVPVGKDEDGEPITSIVMIPPDSSVVQIADDAAQREAEWRDMKISSATKLIGLFGKHFEGGAGATKAEIRALSKQRGMADSTFYAAWTELEKRHVISKVAGREKFQLVPIDERMSDSQDHSSDQLLVDH